MSRVVEAFHHLGQGRRIGRVVVSADGDSLEVARSPHVARRFRADATYLITGGLGGLGLRLARWLTQRGVAHLILAGRSAPSVAAEQAVQQLREAGANVTVSATRR
jgi:nicotinamidase-related amidase